MAKNIIKKITLILLTIIVGFLINNKEVKAASGSFAQTDGNCAYMVPMTYINSSGNATKMSISPITYYQIKSGFNGNTTTAATFIKAIRLYEKNGVFKFRIQVDGSNKTVFIPNAKKTDKELKETQLDFKSLNEYANSSQGNVKISKNYSGCPTYIKFYRKDNTWNFDEATESNYKEYLQSGRQYLTDKNDVSFAATADVSKSSIGDLDSAEFISYLTSSEPVLVSIGNEPAYSTNKWEKFKKEIEGKSSEDLSAKSISVMGVIMDTKSNDARSHSKIYYDVTKDSINKDINSSLSGSIDDMSPVRKRSFIQWFYYTGRYVFEDDVERFSKYFKFLYGDANDKTKVRENAKLLDDGVDNGVLDQETYTNIINALDGCTELNKEITRSENLDYDRCYTYCKGCLSTSGDACTQCTAASEDYKKCADALEKAYATCAHTAETSKKDCIDGTFKSNMGDSYTAFEEKYNELKTEIEQGKADAVNQITSSLYKVDMPSLHGIEFSKDGYEIKCEDVDFLHNYYMVIIILAPILVILFGSIDFAKAVIASDEKKMQEFKSKFPKRLGLLVVLIIVPLIIRLILGVTDLDMDLMECVINGYN